MKKYFSVICSMAMVLLLAAGMVQAASVTWDPGKTGSSDGVGTWLDIEVWREGAANVTWNNDTPDNAIIGSGGTGGTITLGVVSAGTVLINNFSGTYTLSGTSLDQTGGITVGSTAGAVTITSIISGAGGLTMAGTGRLTLSNTTNSYSGQLSIENGELYWANVVNNNNANGVFGNSALPVILGASGQTARLSILRDGATTSNKDFTLATGGTGEIQFGNGNWGVPFQITGADRPLTLSGSIGGAGNLVKLGWAAVVLSGSNNYSGTTTVNEGPLRLTNANALPGGIGATGGASALTINGNGVLDQGAVVELTSASGDFLRSLGTGSAQFQIPGGVSGFSTFGSARNVIVGNDAAFELQWGSTYFNPSTLVLNYRTVANNVLTLQNKLDLNGATRTVAVNANTATLSGDIRTSIGTAGLTKTGAGTLVLSGANTYNGPTSINAGTLTISNAATFTNTSAINLAFGARLEVSAANASLAKLVAGTGVPFGTFLRYSSQTQTAAGPANGPGTILGTVEINLTNVNPDYTLDFGAASTFTNLVAATYTPPITLSGDTSINSSAQPFTLTTGGITASSAGTKTLTLTGSNTGANTIGSVIGNGSGTIAVTKSGNGAWTLSGANTYSGATTVSAGTLILSGANGALGSSAVTIAGGTMTVTNVNVAASADRLSDSLAFTMNGGTFNFNNDASANDFSESVGALTLIGGASTVAIGQAASGRTSTLTFASLSRTAGAINFTGAGLTTAVDPRSKITFTSAPALVNGIIGPWATVNGTAYATLSGNDLVAYGGAMTEVNRGTGGTKAIPNSAGTDVLIIEGTAPAANITLAGATTTTIRSLLNSTSGGAALAATIDIASGKTLLVDSITAVPTATTTFALTLGTAANTGTLQPATAGGDLLLVNNSTAANYINANNNMTVNSVIADNTSASTVTKDGAGVLRLPGNNTYSGGTVINAGHLVVKADANLGAAGTGITFNASGALSFGNHPATTALTIDLGTRPITINNGALAGLYHNWANVTTTISGDITGNGGIIWGRDPVLTFNGGDGYQRAFLLSHNNTFTGPLTVGVGNENIGVDSYFRFNSLGNSANPITLTRNNIRFDYNSGATADLTVDRPIVLADTSPTLRNYSAYKLTYNGPLLTSGTGARTLILGGTGAGLSTYGGDIADGAGQPVAVTKENSGTWALGGTNTYSGVTDLFRDGGQLTILGKAALSSYTTITAGRSTTLSLRMDDSGTVNLGNTVQLGAFDTSANINNYLTIDVRNNGGVTAGSTLVLGKLDFVSNPGNTSPGRGIRTTGANDYRLQFGDVDLHHAIAGTAAGGPHRLEPQSAPITIAGTIRQINGNTGASTTDNNLYLGGIASGNLVSGTIADAADYPTNPNATPLNVNKAEASEWTLSGTNTYSGGTTISAGTLNADSASALGVGDVTVSGASTMLVINHVNAMTNTAALSLPSAATANLTLNANLEVAVLYIAGVPQPYGTYTSSETWLTGTGTLKVGPDMLYWDSNGATAGSGGPAPSGTWGVDSYWSSSPAGTNATAAWSSGLAAVFSAGSDATGEYTVTVSGTQNLRGFTFKDGTVTVTGGTALNLVGTSLVYGDVPASQTGTVVTVISGAGAIVKGGAGTLLLSGNNTFSGGVNLATGALGIGHDNALGIGTVTLSGGTPQATGGDRTITNDVVLSASTTTSGTQSLQVNGTLTHSGGNRTLTNNISTGKTLTLAGQVNLSESNTARTLTIDGTGNTVISGVVANGGTVNGAITKTGAGTLTLSNPASTYGGINTISAGVLEASKLANGGQDSSIGKSANTDTQLLLANGTTLRYIGTSDSTDRRFRFNGNLAGLTITLDASGSGAVNFTNATTPSHSSGNQARTLNLAGTNTAINIFAANLANNGTGAMSVNKNGPGTWALTGACIYTGATTVNSGTLLVNGSLAAGSAVSVEGGILGGTGAIGGSVTVKAAGSVAPGAGGAGTLTVSGNLDISALAGGAGKLKFELDTLAGTSDRIVVTGTLTIGLGLLGFSDFDFTDLGGMEVGTYTLITSGGLDGTLDGADLSGNVGIQSGALQINGNNIELVVKASGSVFMFK